jgi:hypothetical protein
MDTNVKEHAKTKSIETEAAVIAIDIGKNSLHVVGLVGLERRPLPVSLLRRFGKRRDHHPTVLRFVSPPGRKGLSE